MKPYAKYKDSSIKWLGEIPEHWDVQKLKYLSFVQFSNVDKHTLDGEKPVRLCNYSDVYYNDYINNSVQFMEATASVKEINKFKLEKGDVLLTKDSEAWDDIAVPAYVLDEFDNVLCGYHLAQARPINGLFNGKFLFRCFCARGINDQFRVEATGVTRFGLGKYYIDNGLFPVPSLDEQQEISDYIDCTTAHIDKLIAKKQRQIELLQEKRAALISRAVTKGLNPDVKMKDSGIEWLGDVPEHWEIKRLRHVARCLDGQRIPLNAEQRGNMQGEYPYWGANGIVDHLNEWIFDEELVLLGEDGAPFLEEFKDVAFFVIGKIWVNNHIHVLRPNKIMNPCFLAHILNITAYAPFIEGTTRDKLTQNKMNNIPVLRPPPDEQSTIVDFLDRETTKTHILISRLEDSIEMLRQYRMALISAAVTGKIDVRGEVAA